MHSSSTTSPEPGNSDEPKHTRRRGGRKRFGIYFTLGVPPYDFFAESTEKYETAKARDQALAEWESSTKTGWRTKSAGWAATPFDT